MTPPTNRVLPDDVAANIKHEFYFTADAALPFISGKTPIAPIDEETLSRFTICILVLQNGFVAHGTNIPVSKINWNAALGRKYAKDKALETVWEVMGYEMRSKLHAETLKE